MRYDRGYTITENISTLGYSISLWKGILEKYSGTYTMEKRIQIKNLFGVEKYEKGSRKNLFKVEKKTVFSLFLWKKF